MMVQHITFMGFSPIWSRPEWMVCQVLAICPPAVRPSVKHDAQQRSEDDITHIIVNIIIIPINTTFKILFDKFSKSAGKEQYLIPYFIAAHPGSDDEDMLNLSLWLKERNFKPDQVQTFYPSPMALATAMYYSERNPLERVRYKTEKIPVIKDLDQRQRQKAFLRYHDEKNMRFRRGVGWPQAILC